MRERLTALFGPLLEGFEDDSRLAAPLPQMEQKRELFLRDAGADIDRCLARH